MDNYSFGVYLLQLWADAAGTDRPTLVAYYKGKYGQDAITSLGQAGQSIHVDSYESEVKKLISQGSSPDQPTQADLNQALLDLGSQPVSITSAVIGGVEDAATQAASAAGTVASYTLSTLKYVAIIAAVGLVVYVAVQAGVFRRVAARS